MISAHRVMKKAHSLLKCTGHMGAKWKLLLSQIANLEVHKSYALSAKTSNEPHLHWTAAATEFF
jgi:hypothetical protein